VEYKTCGAERPYRVGDRDPDSAAARVAEAGQNSFDLAGIELDDPLYGDCDSQT
jgi:hypothetical protein